MAGTKERILETALQLFNEGNTQSATTNHIAAAAGISPGNLHYHYKNREAIIRRLYTRMHTELLSGVPTEPLSARKLIDWHAHLFEVQWKYRFFLRELLYLLSRDETLKAQYQQDTRSHKLLLFALLQQLRQQGELTLPYERDVEHLCDMLLLIGQFWSAFMQLCDENHTQLDARTGVLRIEETLRPYLAHP